MFKIKLLLFSLIFFSIVEVQAQESTTFILVRHAEKVDDGTRDPDLSKEGVDRAAKMAEVLQKVPITAVYSTDYKRTRNTVNGIAEQKGLEMDLYDPRDSEVLNKILAKEKGGTVLISGHSNTIPTMINQLAKTNYPNFSEKEYDNLVFVIIKPENTPTVIWLTLD